MGDFFHGWRRKVGCVSLVIGVLAAAIEIRSQSTADILTFTVVDRQHQVYSSQGRIDWIGAGKRDRDYPYDGWRSVTSTCSGDLRRAELSFWMGLVIIQQHWAVDFRQWQMPIMGLALPFTLLSAYLILWKPRKRASPI